MSWTEMLPEPLCSLPPDQAANVVCMVAAYPLALVAEPLASSVAKATGAGMAKARMGVGSGIGLAFCLLALGVRGMAALFTPLAGAWLLLTTLPKAYVHLGVLVFMLTALSCAHAWRMYTDPYGWTLDFTGPLMIATVKVTSMAFSVADGVNKPWAVLDSDGHKIGRGYAAVLRSWQALALDAPPTLEEYISFLLYFPVVLAGPVVDMRAYLQLVRCGPQASLAARSWEAVKRLGLAIGCYGVFVLLSEHFPQSLYFDPAFIGEHSLGYRALYMYLAQTGLRFRYYFAFALAEGACRGAGLVAVTNVDIVAIETAQNFKVAVENWNIGVARWLKLYVYHRVAPGSSFINVLATNVAGAIWHGFYPGYYLAFLLGSFCTQFSRLVRRKLRPHALAAGTWVKAGYDTVGWAGSALILGYGSVPRLTYGAHCTTASLGSSSRAWSC
ncbi:membrane bound O-acyl transferase [Thecamonas trahens ATCC 50062]|uniref:Membrane bound O-acyl transferase n=1 Tax=Thecamonas trahens ATCC 50062 TaxID=461836 RepID=A0A0L0DFH4_THETB|nr:membrane bound O-acyl transferase [Thecamonas trahens ATCC 50062]KNC51062.1 membrane bound O-acyl transferase [Thecamonas trahens ATCC 50062]|eukprot:XP_013756523.1 membrane bound O-acyl transferase [Thecamonas trahens ATCC 50062]